jgi:hypothetical protein
LGLQQSHHGFVLIAMQLDEFDNARLGQRNDLGHRVVDKNPHRFDARIQALL